MASLARVLQKIFGSSGGTSEFGEIGSDAIGSPTTTKDLATIQGLSQYLLGLYALTNNAQEPPRIEDMNSLFFLTTSQLSYIFQAGIPEYLSTENYYANKSIVQYSGSIYLAITGSDVTPNNNNTPGSSPTNWRLLVDVNGAVNKAIAGEIYAMTLKATIEDTDVVVIEDNATTPTAFGKKKSTFKIWKDNTRLSNVVVVTQNYTILDTLQHNATIIANPNTAGGSGQYGTLSVTMPAGANNIGKEFTIRHSTNSGLVKILPNGSEKISYRGNDLAYLYLYQAGDEVTLYWNSNSSKWAIKHLISTLDTGWYQCNDETDMKFPSPLITYNSKSGGAGAVSWEGMAITESTSNNTFVVLEDTGGTGTSGIFRCYLATGTGIVTNARTLTASNGHTANVNESGGSSKNKSDKIYHNFDVNFEYIKTNSYFSTDKAVANNRLFHPNVQYSSTYYGQGYTGADSNSFYFSTYATGALAYDAAAAVILTTADLYFRHILKFEI